jgi:CubicO group peptidase (beta-lactamase class C family)
VKLTVPSKLTIAIVLVLVLGICAGTARASPREAEVEAFLAHRWPARASGTVLVARRGRAIACEGIGWADRARHVRASCDTAYDIMSMTKQFTAAAILKLQMMGRLRVADPIDRFIGRVPPDKRAITIADLHDQTSGQHDSLGGDYEPLSRGRMVREAMRSRLLSPPGRTYHYSNVGYSLLAVIVERASGTSYERFLRHRLFRPAGMRHTGYVLPHWRRDQVAVEYDRRGRPTGTPLEHPWAQGGPYWNLRGNGGLISTARDMLRWHRALLGNAVLDRAAKRALFAPRVPEGPRESYAYGWNILPTRVGPLAIHNGGNERSFGVIADLLRRRAMVFWVSNHAYQRHRWNLEEVQSALTVGALCRARTER